MDGVTTLGVDPVAVSDELLVNRSGSTSVQKVTDLARQLAGSGAVAEAIQGAAVGLVRASTLLSLSAIAGTRVGQPGEVTADGNNTGSYSWSGTEWVRVGDISAGATQGELDQHVADQSNPHRVTKGQVGLGNVDDTADIDKPVSNAARMLLGTMNEQIGTRPGDVPDFFIDRLDGGDPAVLPPIDRDRVRFDDAGLIIRQLGDGIVANRALYPLEPSRRYLIEYAVQRRVNSPDPDNDAIKCAMAWYDQARTAIGQAVVQNLLGITTGSGRLTVQAVVSRAAGDNVNVVSPANARYCRPFVQTYGTLVQSDVEVIRWTDITNVSAFSPDLSALEGRTATLESVDAGPRLDAIESEVTAPNTIRLATRSDLIAAHIAATADRVQVAGEESVADRGNADFVRADAATGDTQADDGSWWRDISEPGRVYPTTESLATFSVPPRITTIATAGFSSPGDGGEWPRAIEVANAGDLKPSQRLSNSGRRRWQIAHTGNVYANAFGFSPSASGVANRKALQDAIDYAAEVRETILAQKYRITRSDVLLSPEQYVVDGIVDLYSGVRIIGSGQANTELKHTGGGSDFFVYKSTDGEFLYNSWLVDLAIKGADKTTSGTLSAVRASSDDTGLAIYGCGVSRCLIDNCYDGIGLKNSWTFEVSESEMYDVGRNFVRGENMTAVRLVGNRLDLAGEDGIYATFSSPSLETIAFHIEATKVQSCMGRGIYGMDADHVMWDHAYVEACNQAGGFPAVEFASVSGSNAEMYSFVGGWVSPGTGQAGQPAFRIAKARMVSSVGTYIRGNKFSVGWELGAGVESRCIIGEFNGGTFETVAPGTTGFSMSRLRTVVDGLNSETHTTSSSSSNQNSSSSVRVQELNCASGGRTFTLLDTHLQRGRRLTVQKTDGGNGALIIAPSGTTKINGANASVSSTAPFARAEITCGYEAATSTLCWYVKFI